MVERLDLDAVGFIAKRESWYPPAVVARAAPAARAVLRPVAVGYGYSMGGYAALKHGRLLGLTHALAVAPQVSIDPAEAPWEPRAQFFRPPLHAGMRVAAADLAPAAFVLADPYDAEDWPHLGLLEATGARVRAVPVPFMGHAVVWLMNDSAFMQRVLAQLLQGEGEGLRPLLRGRRRGSPVYLRRLGAAALRLGHAARAERLFAACGARGVPAAALDDDRARALRERAARLLAGGGPGRGPDGRREAAALAALQDLLALRPTDAAAQAQCGHLRLGAGDAAGAEPFFHAALALDGGLDHAQLGLSLALDSQGRAAEALAAARAAAAQLPGHARVLEHLGHMSLRAREVEEAERAFRAALAIDPCNGAAQLGLSLALARRRGRRHAAEALAAARAAAAALPGHAPAAAWLGRLLLRAGDAAAGGALVPGRAQARRRVARARLGLAKALLARGRAAAALQTVRRAAATRREGGGPAVSALVLPGMLVATVAATALLLATRPWRRPGGAAGAADRGEGSPQPAQLRRGGSAEPGGPDSARAA
jgi:tetratricopeptide (TPR) repeat protein